jgi:hypothetical protein
MSNENGETAMLKKLIVALGLATLLAAPAFAQSYTATYGTGNVINLPLAEKSNGAQGFGPDAFAAAPAAGSSAYAYAPKRKHAPRKMPPQTR